MKHYKTVTEVKQNLPEILDRINTCKELFNCATKKLKLIQKWCVDECAHPEHNYGNWTSLETYSKILINQMNYLAEMEYLQGLVDKLPQYKNQII